MPGVLRYAGGLCAVAIALALAGGHTAVAASVPAGPRLAFTRWADGPKPLSIVSVGPDGSAARTIVAGGKRKRWGMPFPFEGPAWSPDGSLIAYGGFYKPTVSRIFLATADGSGIRSIQGTEAGEQPVFASDGRTIAFSKTRLDDRRRSGKSFFGTTAWVVDIESGASRRLTPWRNGLVYEPSSFSPDGSLLAMSRSRGSRQDAVVVDLTNGKRTVIAHQVEAPVYSPDGLRIALLGYPNGTRIRPKDRRFPTTDLFVKESGRGDLRRLTHTHRRWEGKPSWDPSGERLVYTRSGVREILPFGFSDAIMETNRDGTCARRVFNNQNSDGMADASPYGPVWQPGPGREAGRIEC